MKPRSRLLAILIAALGIGALLAWLLLSGPRHRIALIRVVNTAGQPVAGAVIRADGLRPKPGPYSGGHYGWRSGAGFPPNDPVTTDAQGWAAVPYPRYVFERIETGELSFSVHHPDLVSDRPFRTVATRPPSGAPWKVWAEYLWARVRLKALVARPDPVVLQDGAILRLEVRRTGGLPPDARLYAQASGVWSSDTNFWIRTGPGVLETRRLASGSQTVRALQIEPDGQVWYSPVTSLTAVPGQTQTLALDLQRGAHVRGQLDAKVPRPVKSGRVVAHVWPTGHPPQASPPDWHACTPVAEAGTFELTALPPGDLEIVALCDGFVSTNGPGQFKIRYPQKHVLGTQDLELSIGMEPTARLEVRLTDEQGHPVSGAQVSTWPNVRYGEWFATILASDCYQTRDFLVGVPPEGDSLWGRPVPDFSGRSDASGVAALPNLPVDVTAFAVEHPEFALPAVSTDGGNQRREGRVTLVPGVTNRVSVRLEPRERSPIRHY